MRAIVFCTTCRFSREDQLGPNGVPGGEMLLEEMRRLLADRKRTDVSIERQACLWACTRHCNVAIRDSERFSYLAGDFKPVRESAEAILEYFDLHGLSARGEVPFRQWPQGMRGHFIARLPPR
jgi:predicted metal-binding protein